MKTKFCARCERDTPQNPIKKKSSTSEQEYRCTQCGFPIRTGGNAKNFGVKLGVPPRIKWFGPGERVA